MTADRSMRFARVHHVSINVTDIDESRRFYGEVLGLASLPRPDFGFPGEWLDAGEQQIHLIEAKDFEAPDGRHFALEVDDLDATIAVLNERGVDVSEPADIDGVCRQAFFSDPTGNLIELNQPTG
ncbi:MAG: VOC family protein [Ilumatobacteraceae bacterium]